MRAADAQAASGDLSGARELLVDAVEAATAELGPDHLDVLDARARLAGVHRDLGALNEARRVLESVLEVGHRTHGVAHPRLLLVSYDLAVIAHELGNAYEAGRNFRLLDRWGPEVLGADHHHVLAARRYLGEDVPGEIDAPPPLPLPPVGPAPSGQSILDGPPPVERRRRFPVTAAVAGMALFALVATVVGVWVIPGRDGRVESAPQAAPVTPSVTPSADGSPTPSAALSGSNSALPPANGGSRTPTRATSTTTAPQTLGSGRYLIHAGHTGMCLGLGPELFKNTGRTVLGQHPCGSNLPQLTLEPVATNTYRIKVTDSDGTGCADVDYAGTTEGLLLAPQACNDKTDQRFTFEPVTAPVAGYRLRSVAGSRFCIGVLEGKQQSGVQIMQDTCRNGPHEVFTLERRQ
ncbi:hypothetical protein GCM10009557_82220 [Virgisporangium ochraceum]|uniref:Ricin B lectin domain-containing protein n=1 Tax=Virgisporangium ochraceum TaxID=65505 RepID=A0A8J4E7U9_9ACTN|nr:hypothetical protein Voc01_004170 [Virgisporangium ochraceum]